MFAHCQDGMVSFYAADQECLVRITKPLVRITLYQVPAFG
jgi:hypothetical protein